MKKCNKEVQEQSVQIVRVPSTFAISILYMVLGLVIVLYM